MASEKTSTKVELNGCWYHQFPKSEIPQVRQGPLFRIRDHEFYSFDERAMDQYDRAVNNNNPLDDNGGTDRDSLQSIDTIPEEGSCCQCGCCCACCRCPWSLLKWILVTILILLIVLILALSIGLSWDKIVAALSTSLRSVKGDGE